MTKFAKNADFPKKRVFSATKVVFVAFSINFGHILTYSPNSANIEILKNRSEWRVRPLWGEIGLFEKHAENGNADFHARASACTRVGGPSNPQIRDKRDPEIIFKPLITILAPKLIEIRYILKSGNNETFCVEKQYI